MCLDCGSDIILNDPGYNGYSPVYANVESTCDGDDIVIQQLVGWINGSGPLPQYDSNYMTDAWLTANPLYLGTTGWVEIPCDAVNILGPQGPQGIQGATGYAGTNGSAGESGCDPDITITAQVSGSEPYNVTVTRLDDPLTPCFPEYNLEFPIEMITENTEVTNAIDAAVLAALTVTPEADRDISLSTGNSSNLKYAFSGGTGTVTLPSSLTINDSWITYYQVGNIMTINFRIKLTFGGTGINNLQLEMLIPNSKTSISDDYSNSISLNRANEDPASSVNMYPVISTNSITGNTHLLFSFNSNLNPMPAIAGSDLHFMGQFSFPVN